MGARRKQREGPRQALRWIGDAFVLEGDLETGAPAVWRGLDERGRREPRCARVRIREMSMDWEYDVDERPLYLAGAELKGDALVTRLATYREQDLLAIVDDDVADLSLVDLFAGLREASGVVPVGLAVHVARACARACQAAAAHDVVLVSLRPADIALAWDGSVWCRPAVRSVEATMIDDVMDHDDPVGAVLYEGRPQQRVVGILVHQLLGRGDPFTGNNGDEDDDDDGYEVAEQVQQRMAAGDHLPLPDALHDDVKQLISALLSPNLSITWDALVTALDALAVAHPFGAAELAGTLAAFFPDQRRACAIEREDRLLVMPGPRVEPEAWVPLDASDMNDEDTNGEYDLDDVRRGHPDFDGVRIEPSVDAIDPFDDEEKR